MENTDTVIVSDFDGNDFTLNKVEYSEVGDGDSYLHENKLMRKSINNDDSLIVTLDGDDIENLDKLI